MRDSAVNNVSTPALWGWTPDARAVLAALAAVLAVGLVILAWMPGEGRVATSPELLLDPNTAPPEVLTVLPRMGPALLARFIKARQERAFDSLDDIDHRVRGVGPRTIDNWQPYLRIAPEVDQTGVSR
jgi:DNA uptake protein ComE-like DNA-binding protein